MYDLPTVPPAGAAGRDPVTEAISASTEAVVELHAALAGNGITLPSLGIDLASCTRTVDPRPLVELGRCNLETARALTAALERAAVR
ncbi:hypothetical protein ACLIYM_05715 [Streptomyces fenghuangensis]|uniref:hypothetical protein n=1 Tax=Streptomyces sp. ICN903 TaxID=2964654 RepID=UPI00211229CD|nr:hypothetical protein [Streptomyces sp. ICN903]